METKTWEVCVVSEPNWWQEREKISSYEITKEEVKWPWCSVWLLWREMSGKWELVSSESGMGQYNKQPLYTSRGKAFDYSWRHLEYSSSVMLFTNAAPIRSTWCEGGWRPILLLKGCHSITIPAREACRLQKAFTSDIFSKGSGCWCGWAPNTVICSGNALCVLYMDKDIDFGCYSHPSDIFFKESHAYFKNTKCCL